MNNVIIDGRIQENTNLFSDIASFNISALTGKFKLVNNKEKNRFTYIRVIYPFEVDDYIESIIQPNTMIRVYGKLDSEQYETDSGKIVYNKVISADKLVRIHFNKDTNQYEEVI